MITTEDGQMLTTVGLDLGDKTIQACFVSHHGEIVEESRLRATDAALRRRFSGEPRYRLAPVRSTKALGFGPSSDKGCEKEAQVAPLASERGDRRARNRACNSGEQESERLGIPAEGRAEARTPGAADG